MIRADVRGNRSIRFTLPMLIGMLLCFSSSAFTQSESAGTVSEAPPAQPAVIWIQDPWSGVTKRAMVRPPDMSLWNGARITDYEEAISVKASPALGVLTINAINVQVPIYNGTDEFNLDRGAGRIKGMARMDGEGHLAISGHRDGFFRNLKDIEVGDDILIQTPEGVVTYSVDSIKVVHKEDVSVLRTKADDMLTLITCYPFYFQGNAPDRYIVTAFPKPLVLE